MNFFSVIFDLVIFIGFIYLLIKVWQGIFNWLFPSE